jgi:thymidylate kinase
MFVVIDGPNGSGKTSIIQNLKEKGFNTLSSPNGTPLAKMLRPACRGSEPWVDIDKRIQFLLFSAARLDEYIRCVHDKSEVIVADRWWTSTYVYQCVLQGISELALEMTIHEDEQIDLVIILTGKSEELIARVRSEREKNPNHGNCTWTKESETMIRLNQIYVTELPRYLKRQNIPFRIINTSDKDLNQVQQEVESVIANLSI